MYEINSKLEMLEEQGKPIKIGLIGTGQMGSEIVIQVEMMKGIEIDVAVDLNIKAVRKAFDAAGYTGKLVETNDIEVARKAIESGKKVISTNYNVAIQSGSVQVVVDATGSPEMGARIAFETITHKKHIVMMNVECDVTIGPILKKLADNAGVIYSLTAGDEPGSIIEVFRFAQALGYKVVAAGKGKNNPLDIYATPDQWEQRARERGMSAKMLVEFVDGSKTMIEMAAVANATGLKIDKRGMHGVKCNIAELAKKYCLKSQGGVLDREGVVDFAIGDINPGVFVIITTDNDRMKEAMIQRDMGKGPNYLLLRPYHLCSIETPITAAQAVLYNESSAHPLGKLTTECITIAKKDLKKGEVLDSIGEYCYRASIEMAETAREENMLPVGLAKGAILNTDVKRDQIITYDMVDLNNSSMLLQLRRLQDSVCI